MARRMLTAALEPFCDMPLTRVAGDPTIAAGITLRPNGALWLAGGWS